MFGRNADVCKVFNQVMQEVRLKGLGISGLDGSETDYRCCTYASQLLSSQVYNLCTLGVASLDACTKRSFGRSNVYVRSTALVVVTECLV